MKKIAKLFLIVILWALFVWVTSATDWENPEKYTEHVTRVCQCNTPFREGFSMFFLFIICWFLVILSLCSITLYKKHKDKLRNPAILCIPMLNLYQLFKITIWRIRFYCIIIFIWFFGYLIYSNRDWCCDSPYWLIYPVFVTWFLSICILVVFLVKLIIISKKSDKKLHQEQNTK